MDHTEQAGEDVDLPEHNGVGHHQDAEHQGQEPAGGLRDEE